MEHSEVYTIRRSEERDQIQVLELDSPSKDARRAYFGRTQVGVVIETSLLALTATDPARPERVLGFAAFDSSPLGEVATEACFPAFLEHKFDLPPTSSFVFLTYIAQRQAKTNRSPVLKHLLQTTFGTLSHIQCVLLVFPEDVNLVEAEPALAKFFERVPARSTPMQVPKGSQATMAEWRRLEQQFAKNDKKFCQFTVYQAKVEAFYPPVKVRRARVEDHDDVEPILTAQADSVSSAFGEYFLAELINDQDEHNVCLIAEASSSTTSCASQNRAVGLLAISDQIDVCTLQDNFALKALNDLANSTSATDAVTPPRLVIAGPPAGGKGTQCELLVEAFNVLHLSTGDLLRAAVASGSPLGLKAQQFMDSGQLVPDELIVDVVLDRLGQSDCEVRGWLLDGFPRTATQAEALLAAGFCPDAVIALDVPDEEVVRRIAGRRVDPETGKTYHLEFNPPPEEELVLARLVQRSDDTEATIRERLSTFHKHLASVLSAFQSIPGSRGAQIITVNGLQSKHVVAQYIIHQIRIIKTAQKLQVLIQRRDMTPPKLVISGPPAGGKGTQCEQLVALLNIVHLSTGDILRQAIRDGSPLGIQAQNFMNGGQLVPDELIMNVVLERIVQPDCERRGWLLDGFPRTSTQAEALLAARNGKAAPDYVLVLDVPDDEVIRRIAGRRVDPETGKTYHVDFNPPPPEIKARVIQRSDDTEETLRTRLEQFHAHSDSVLATFKAYRGDNGSAIQIIRSDGLQLAPLITKAFMTPMIQRCKEAEASLLQRSGADSFLKMIRAEARTNCFAITLFCVDENAFERSSSMDLLSAAFAAFPTRDYCLLTLPTHAREPPCLKFFSRIPANPASTFTHALYVLHREAISFFCPRMSDDRIVLNPVRIDVQRFLPSDVSAAEDKAELAPFITGLNRQARLEVDQELASAMEEAESDLKDLPRHVAFIVRANGRIVGLATLERQPDMSSFLPQHFDIDRVARMTIHRPRDLAFVRHLILNPIFASCSRFVLLELMRLFQKTCLMYQVPTEGSDKSSPALFSALDEFVLAPPRRGVRISTARDFQATTRDDENLDDSIKDERERRRQAALCAAFALFVLPKRLLSEPKLTVNQRIVFVGASDAALSCLTRLVAIPYLHFSNLTLVSSHGLMVAPTDEDEDITSPKPSNFVRKSLFNAVELKQFSLRTHVRVVASRMVRLDRNTRAIILQDGSCIPYDYLALTAGLQDGTCTALGKLPRFVDEDFSESNGKMIQATYSSPVVPDHMVALGDLSTAQWLHTAMNKALTYANDGNGEVFVVYGSTLLALQVIQALLARGIKGNSIHHVSPSREKGYGVFEDAVVRAEMDKQYSTSGVSLHAGMKIIQIETKPENDSELQGVRIMPLHDSKNTVLADGGTRNLSVEGKFLSCSWLLCCQQNDSDADLFRAVNESGLVYDGRLVVDGQMRTTDTHVLAAGTLCRFSRRFIDAKLHEGYSSLEGGKLLANSLLQLVDPLALLDSSSIAHSSTQSTKTRMIPPPKMEMPIIRSAVVLGGKHYVQVSVPDLTNTLALHPLSTNTASQATDVNLIDTDNRAPSSLGRKINESSRYTCLFFDDVGVLIRLEYLGDDPVSVRNLQNLVGLHEAYLNSAVASYSAGKVVDWVTFFAQPWASALYHDRFPAFRARLREFLAKDDEVRAIADDAVAFMRETGDTMGAIALAQERVGRGGGNLEPSTRRLVESQVLEFLSSNRDVLNMFLLPKGQQSSK
ncbi:putative cilia-and flagella-associated protein [Plasmopara halstedii]